MWNNATTVFVLKFLIITVSESSKQSDKNRFSLENVRKGQLVLIGFSP